MNISAQEKLLLVRHLAMLLTSGIPLLEALQILSSQTKSKSYRKLLDQISSDIQNGSTLAKSLQKHPKIFDAFFVGIVAVGEDSGTLDESLRYLYEHLAKSLDLRKKIASALLYPTVVVVAALLVAASVIIFVIPQLLNLFQGLNVTLPPITRAFIAIATFLQQYGLILIVGIIVASILFRIGLGFSWFRKIVDTIVLRLPIFGNVLVNTALTTTFRNIGIMMKSGLPITSSLEIARQMANQKVFEEYLRYMFLAVEKGKSLAAELEDRKFAHMPVMAIKMLAVGEKTGKLDETCLYLADFFEQEVDEATKNMTVLLEPIILLIVGVLVAFVALSIISPIYELTGSIQP